MDQVKRAAFAVCYLQQGVSVLDAARDSTGLWLFGLGRRCVERVHGPFDAVFNEHRDRVGRPRDHLLDPQDLGVGVVGEDEAGQVQDRFGCPDAEPYPCELLRADRIDDRAEPILAAM